MVKTLSNSAVEYRAHNIIPRWYMTAEQVEQYGVLFREEAGADGHIDSKEMADFMGRVGLKISADNLDAIMHELDQDGSGFIEEDEFLVLIVKIAKMRKRKVGPGLCPLAQLVKEGWSHRDLIKIGYKSQDFRDAGFSIAELLKLFTVPELTKGGVALQDLLQTNWNGEDGRDAGFTLNEMYESRCSVQKIRTAGYKDVMSAVHLRKLGIGAKQMQLGGFSISDLKMSGFSGAELRVAGFSHAALQAVHGKMLMTERAATPNPSVREQRRLRRPNTFRIREELDSRPEDLPPRPSTVA
jgi:hypothetical protein